VAGRKRESSYVKGRRNLQWAGGGGGNGIILRQCTGAVGWKIGGQKQARLGYRARGEKERRYSREWIKADRRQTGYTEEKDEGLKVPRSKRLCRRLGGESLT